MTEEYSAPEIIFRFVEFNPRRDMRGVEAARVEILCDGEVDSWLWMSRADILANIKEFGAQEGLQQALAAYKK